MTPIPAPLAHARPLVHWRFENGPSAMTCEVASDGPRAYDVMVFEQSLEHRRAIQRFDVPSGALIRHATIVSALRNTGWRLTTHSR